MEKQTVLNQIRSLAGTKAASREEILTVVDEALGLSDSYTDSFMSRFKLSVSGIVSVIGALIVFIGIIALVVQFWSGFSGTVKIGITLGVSALMLISALLVSYGREKSILSEVLFLLSALLLPVGLFVSAHVLNITVTNGVALQTSIALICLVVFGTLFLLTRRIVSMIFTTVFATWLYFAFLVWMVGSNPLFADRVFFSLITLIAGLAYLSIGHFLSKSEGQLGSLSGAFLTLGTIAFLGGGIAVGGVVGDSIFIFLVAGIIYASTWFGSRSMLVFGSLFLMGYILKLTSVYFADSVGWPLALVVSGFALIGVGYMGVNIGRRFIK
ncbi:MAG: DUF2157 domain-containing protein [Candidatus Paceibacterota bacterium]|jgi:uncharacterized membrane protein (UPF0136 family)